MAAGGGMGVSAMAWQPVQAHTADAAGCLGWLYNVGVPTREVCHFLTKGQIKQLYGAHWAGAPESGEAILSPR